MAFKRIRRTFQYEPEVPDDYTEHGVEKGAKAEDGKIDSPDMVRIVSETRGMTLDEVFVWLNDHRAEFSPLPYIIDTDSGEEVEKMKSMRPQFFVLARKVNTKSY